VKRKPAQAGLLDQEPAVDRNVTSSEVAKLQSPADALHVSRVSLRRYGGVGDDERSYDFHEGANVIAGPNASGKTSVLAAIKCALRIDRASAGGNSHIGSALGPEIRLVLRGQGREVTVECIGDKSLRVVEKIGQDVHERPRAVEFLRDLVDVAGANPAAFETAKPDEQAEMLLEALDFPGYSRAGALEAAGLQAFRLPPIPAGLHPLEELEKLVGAVEDSRRAVGNERDTEAATATKLLADLPAQAPKPPGGLDGQQQAMDRLAADIARETEAAAAAHREAEAAIKAAFEQERDRLKAKHEQKAAEMRRDCEFHIARAAAEVETAIDDRRTKGEAELSAADSARDAALKAIDKRKAILAGGRELLAALRQAQTSAETDARVRALALEAKSKAEGHDHRWKELDVAIRALKRYATELAGKAPIKGLEVSFDEKGKRVVRLDGKPLEKLSGSELTALSARVAALRSRQGGTERPLKLILIDEIGRTTLKRRTALLAELTAGGAQVIACLAEEDVELGVQGAA